jgi:hypothetical protein
MSSLRLPTTESCSANTVPGPISMAFTRN